MKHLWIVLGVLGVFLSGCSDCSLCPNSSCSMTGASPKILRHVVLFAFKEGTSEADVKAIEDAFRALPKKIPQIKGFEWGTDVSVENLAQGYTHCFFVTFDSEEGRAAYLPHPDHKAFGAVLGPHLEKVLVIDYWAAK